jgi:hypothetical protein
VAAWIAVSVGLGTAALVLSQVRVKRYSGSQLVAELTLFGRGVYFSRTPEGSGLRLVLRERGRCGWPRAAGDPPPDIGVREPRRPLGRGPKSGAAELAPPDA